MKISRARTGLKILLTAALLLAVASSLFAKEVPPAPDRWVTDEAAILGPTEEDLLNRKLADFEQQSGAQFIVYTFRSLEGDPVEDFTIRCVEKWKVGQKKYDNGIVLFVFFEEKKIRIEVGYGLEGTITDAFASRVIREHITPYFQQGQWAQGLEAGAAAIMQKIRTGEEPVPPMQRGAGRGQQRDIGIIPVLFILFIVFFVIVPMFSRRRSGCSGCIFPFIFPGGGVTFGGGGWGGGGGGGFGGFSGGGFSGGGGGFGGGGATGGW